MEPSEALKINFKFNLGLKTSGNTIQMIADKSREAEHQFLSASIQDDCCQSRLFHVDPYPN